MVDVKLMFLWIRWMSQPHNRNRRSQTKMIPHFQRKENAQKLYLALCEVEGLIEDERFHVLIKIPDYPTQMLIFLTLPSFVQLEWFRIFISTH
ncbi:hypothetical protein Golob_007654 [Gossypium lobatum]|uniref:Uncharacterized protein n=1 Tax=Gossypium lobatum TaxID=34289 RepID=A0A7J8MDB0_9ROSI|nr:hypothetical protein [Gossypium lobatum]